jgi:hypothetical protein
VNKFIFLAVVILCIFICVCIFITYFPFSFIVGMLMTCLFLFLCTMFMTCMTFFSLNLTLFASSAYATVPAAPSTRAAAVRMRHWALQRRTAAPPRRPVAWLRLTACPAPWRRPLLRRSASPLLPSLDSGHMSTDVPLVCVRHGCPSTCPSRKPNPVLACVVTRDSLVMEALLCDHDLL